MYTVFVTGGIGSGKSVFVARLAQRGAAVYDLDAISHEVLEEPDCVEELVHAFGPEVAPHGVVSRRALAARAFETPEATDRLNAITHPRVFTRLGQHLMEGCACCSCSASPVSVVEVQLIDKAGECRALADEVLGILCPRELRREHAVARGMTPEDFDRRDALQIRDEERARYCTRTLENTVGLENLLKMADDWWLEHQRHQ